MPPFFLKTILLIAFIALLPLLGFAGGIEFHNMQERIGSSLTSDHGDVVVGPDAQIIVAADWYIAAEHFYIHPSAQITGTGIIHLMSPATYGAGNVATHLDAGGIVIGCRMSIENMNTVSLNYIDPAIMYPGLGITDNHTTGTDDLILDNSLNFGSASAHVVLNRCNITFTSSPAAGITYDDLNTTGFNPDPVPPSMASQAYFVTNGDDAGTVTKSGIPEAGYFIYPLGQSGPLAAPYDYTPATVLNNSGSLKSYSARVQSYANSASLEGNTARGMDRTWQVTADAAGNATLILTHNDLTTSENIGTDGALFNPEKSYITQQQNPGLWSVDNTTSNGGSPVNVLTHQFIVPVSGSSGYFTKTSDSLHSLALPVALIAFDAVKADEQTSRITWQTANELASDYFEVERSSDARTFNDQIAHVKAAGQSATYLNYLAYDYEPFIGDNFYRLKMVSKDGRTAYSAIKKVHFDGAIAAKEGIALSENPITPRTKLLITAHTDQKVHYSIVDGIGQVVAAGSLHATKGNRTYDLPDLAPIAAGIYYLTVKGTTIDGTLKMLKQE